MFINFDVNTGISINMYRKPSCQAGDLTNLLKAIEEDSILNFGVCCDLKEAKALLNNPDYLKSHEAQYSIDLVLSTIDEYEK